MNHTKCISILQLNAQARDDTNAFLPTGRWTFALVGLTIELSVRAWRGRDGYLFTNTMVDNDL